MITRRLTATILLSVAVVLGYPKMRSAIDNTFSRNTPKVESVSRVAILEKQLAEANAKITEIKEEKRNLTDTFAHHAIIAILQSVVYSNGSYSFVSHCPEKPDVKLLLCSDENGEADFTVTLPACKDGKLSIRDIELFRAGVLNATLNDEELGRIIDLVTRGESDTGDSCKTVRPEDLLIPEDHDDEISPPSFPPTSAVPG